MDHTAKVKEAECLQDGEMSNSPEFQSGLALHPLIDTRLEFKLSQDMNFFQRGERKTLTDRRYNVQ